MKDFPKIKKAVFVRENQELTVGQVFEYFEQGYKTIGLVQDEKLC